MVQQKQLRLRITFWLCLNSLPFIYYTNADCTCMEYSQCHTVFMSTQQWIMIACNNCNRLGSFCLELFHTKRKIHKVIMIFKPSAIQIGQEWKSVVTVSDKWNVILQDQSWVLAMGCSLSTPLVGLVEQGCKTDICSYCPPLQSSGSGCRSYFSPCHSINYSVIQFPWAMR